jgi:Xaa-Pro aminopeptidase
MATFAQRNIKERFMLTLSQPEFAERRRRLIEKLPTDSIALIPSAKEILRNGFDNTFQFRQNSDFWYLTGYNEPDAVLLLIPGRAEGEVVLFNLPNDPKAEIWTGRRSGQSGACRDFGMHQAFVIDEFDKKLPEFFNDRNTIYYPIGRNMKFDRQVIDAMNRSRAGVRRGATAPNLFCNLDPLLHSMRVIKSDAEIAMMQKANDISSEAHRMAMRACPTSAYEYELEGIIRGHCYQQGCRDMAYTPIVGAGENACILHYVTNTAPIKKNDLVLIDAGGEYQHYASDITRTFPANGRFQGEQKIIYDIVLETQLKLIAMVKPGVNWDSIQQSCRRFLTEGLIAADILKGSLDELLQKQAYTPFYMHLFGHYLGLDTHDAGSYKDNGHWPDLQAGMVFTIEPGLYISANTPDVDPRWWNIGVRIEDNIVVTENGQRNLTTAPKSVADIEALMREM